jgi:hypothetical protein
VGIQRLAFWGCFINTKYTKRFTEDTKVDREQLLMVRPISGTSIATIIKKYK